MSEAFGINKDEDSKGVLIIQVEDRTNLGYWADNNELKFMLANYYEECHSSPNIPTSCIVDIQGDFVGSSLARALFELWKKVTARNGELSCINYPKDYIDTIASLGLPMLPGFELEYKSTESVTRVLTMKNLWSRWRSSKG